MSKPFRFKQFEVYQDQCGMKITQDSCFFGAWAAQIAQNYAFNPSPKAIDIGTGTGLLALMLAQGQQFLSITAIEIDPQGAMQAKHNFDHSPWNQTFQLINAPIQSVDLTGFDFVVSNPPFFQNSLINPNKQKQLARHTDSLSFLDLAKALNRLLSEQGLACILLPASESQDFIDHCQTLGLFAQIKLELKATPNKPIHRHGILISRHKEILDQIENLNLSFRDSRGSTTAQASELTQDFYLDSTNL